MIALHYHSLRRLLTGQHKHTDRDGLLRVIGGSSGTFFSERQMRLGLRVPRLGRAFRIADRSSLAHSVSGASEYLIECTLVSPEPKPLINRVAIPKICALLQNLHLLLKSQHPIRVHIKNNYIPLIACLTVSLKNSSKL